MTHTKRQTAAMATILLLSIASLSAGETGSGRDTRHPTYARQLGATEAAARARPTGGLTITDIGSVNGRPTAGFGSNAAGEVAGLSYVTGTIGQIGGPPAKPFIAHAVLYSGGSLEDLGAIEGGALCSPLGCDSRGWDIHASRWIAGVNDGDTGLLADVQRRSRRRRRPTGPGGAAGARRADRAAGNER